MDPSTSTSTSSHALELHNLNSSISSWNQEDVTYMPPPIYRAAAEGDTNFIRRKVRRAVQYLTPNKNTILHIAAQFGQLSCVLWIIQHYCKDSSLLQWPNQHYYEDSSLLQWPNLKGDYPLHLAAREGHLEVVKALIHAARTLSEGDIERGIGADKAMLRMTNNENNTALHEAVRYHHPEVVKLLIQEYPEFTYGVNVSGGTPLYMAAERGFGDLVKIIIENNTTLTPPAHTGPMRRTALHAAVICNDRKMVKEILKWKPDITKEVDENGWSPLHCAAYLGYVSIVRQLLHKSDRSVVYLRVKNDDNKTALHIAATRGHRLIVKLLVLRYPDCCEQVDVNGNNALHLFVMQRGLIHGLLKIPSLNVRALINEKNVGGQTPLHLFADSQLKFYSSLIMNKKVDKMALNNQNLTALDVISLAEDLVGRKGGIIRSLKRAKVRAGPLLWQKTRSNGEDKKHVDNNQRRRDKGSESPDISFLRQVSESHLLVAALVATVSFAAGFTLPGGYNDSDGMAILSKKITFQAFVVSDSMALGFSVTAVLCHFYNALSKKGVQLAVLLRSAYWLTKLGVGAMVIAFLTGLYTVLPHHSGIAILTVIICVCCLVLNLCTTKQIKVPSIDHVRYDFVSPSTATAISRIPDLYRLNDESV